MTSPLAFALLLSTVGQVPAPTGTEKMLLTGLAPAKIVPNLCVLKYRVGTSSPDCQAFFDQALGYHYSYVWMEAARSFETATRYDPRCALAWWGLSRSLEQWGKRGEANRALEKAQKLLDHASHREKLLIQARLREKGMIDGVKPERRHQAAIDTMDEMIALYDDDEEAWYYRAQLAGGARLFGGVASAVPYYKALIKLNPLHPGANHELLHFYDNFHRPALGWVYAENYIKSSPGIPHPFHMQAHLATRLGRWEKTSDRSARAIALERAYHRDMKVKPRDDAQFSHHLEILTVSLTHDGRFREAKAIKAEAVKIGYRSQMPWFRLHCAERDWAKALAIAEEFRKRDKVTTCYLRACVYLREGDVARARSEVEVLQHAYERNRTNRELEYRLWETQGWLLCQSGSPDAGLKLLAKAANRSKDDYGHHAWGNGAYFMEIWGIAALHCGRAADAEEAFLEALAHDPGCVRAALGLQVLCDQQGRKEEAKRYAAMARRSWRKADAGALDAELAYLSKQSPLAVKAGTDGASEPKGGR
jgi:tetratricopeptide (TPR) repeat protein